MTPPIDKTGNSTSVNFFGGEVSSFLNTAIEAAESIIGLNGGNSLQPTNTSSLDLSQSISAGLGSGFFKASNENPLSNLSNYRHW